MPCKTIHRKDSGYLVSRLVEFYGLEDVLGRLLAGRHLVPDMLRRLIPLRRRRDVLDPVTLEKIPRSGNSLNYGWDGPEQVVVKQFVSTTKYFGAYKHRVRTLFGGQLPTRYWPPESRCSLERAGLEIWRKHGYAVPRLMPVPSEFPARTTLCLEYIPGPRLKDALRGEQSSEYIDLVLQTLFEEMRRRHLHAMEISEPRLVHVDANIRNIIMSPRGPVRIDFEATHLDETIPQLATREVKKFCYSLLDCMCAEPRAERAGMRHDFFERLGVRLSAEPTTVGAGGLDKLEDALSRPGRADPARSHLVPPSA